MTYLSKIAAVCFGLWGGLHVIGGMMILVGTMESPAAGYGMYRQSGGNFPELSGAILRYFAYLIVCIGVAVAIVAMRFNWKNSESGLMVNTIVVGLTELGLIVFLLMPGYVGWGEASFGLVVFIGGVVFGGIACRAAHPGAETMGEA